MYTKYFDALKKSILFDGIPIAEYEFFLSYMQPSVIDYKKNDIIIQEGTPVHGVGIILHGTVIQARMTLDGDRAIHDILSEGQNFGEIILMLPHRKTWASSFIAKTNCTLMFFPKDRILAELSNPLVFTNAIFINWVKCICNYVEGQMIALRCLRAKSVRKKICYYVYELHKKYNQLQFMLPYNRDELAAFLNMPQSSLSREMAVMKSEGLIDYYKSTIKILDLKTIVDILS